MKKEIAVIFGGRSCEHDVSVITGIHAYNALKTKNYGKTLVYLRDGRMFSGDKLANLETYIDFSEKGLDEVIIRNGKLFYLRKNKIKEWKRLDCALLCLHGGEGENGAFQGFLEVNGVPYTSTGVFASSAFMDKEQGKRLINEIGLNTVPYIALNKYRQFDMTAVVDEIGFPMIIKPARLGSSIGITKAKNQAELEKGLMTAFCYDNKVLVEKCIEDFIELNCAAFRNGMETVVGVIERPITQNGFLSYDDKYISEKKILTDREIPAKISKQTAELVRNTTKKIYEAFDMGGVVRTDYILQGETLYVNEVNTIPGSLSYYLFSKQGISYSELIEKLIEDALMRFVREDKLIKNFQSEILKNYSNRKENFSCLKK